MVGFLLQTGLKVFRPEGCKHESRAAFGSRGNLVLETTS